MTEYDLVVRARRAVLENRISGVTLGVRDGVIAAVEPIGTAMDGARMVQLADDEILLPGLVDTHVHVNEPGRTEWEGFETATRAAAAGGVTTIVDMPLNSIPPTVDVAALAVKQKSATGECHVDVVFWGGAVPGNLHDLRPLHDAGVFGFKCFLLHSGVEEFPPLTPAELVRYCETIAQFDGLLIVHAEDAGIIGSAPECHGPAYSDFLLSRPRNAENTAIAHVLDAARSTRARVHILHLSCADAVPMLAQARRDGVRVTVETCPHYLSFDAETIDAGATQYKCCPPIREHENRERLWQALADGVIDCIVTDHSPCIPELKRLDVGDFGLAWGGVASLQLGLSAVWTEARARGVDLADVVRWMASAPAQLVGLQRKGALRVGNDADFAVFAPDDEFVVDPAGLQHRNPVTPYAGRSLRGSVRETFLRGSRIDRESARGQFLFRNQA